ncbi:MAG: bifunctional folylpolyglutamate synthase/dihydrofolate synthase, partial [Pseudomonadota bacterium]
MKTDALIEKLSEIHPKGFDLSLGRITDLLEKLGNPHRSIPPAIHVAGTNGKGSTLAFCRAILEEAGYRVHVHTSPHLVSWQERYRLAGELVSDDVLADAVARAAKANNDRPITIFEIMSAVMFMLFSEHEADFSLVEVGLGGRFDATNMISKPLVSVITPVAMDHQAYLGDTLEKIA